jgi:hypothetical protein
MIESVKKKFRASEFRREKGECTESSKEDISIITLPSG